MTKFSKKCVQFATLVLLFVVGCSKTDAPPLGLVSGVITLDGDPVEGAMLTFVPASDRDIPGVSYGKTDANGRYEMDFSSSLKGVPTSQSRVRITTMTDQEAKWRGQTTYNKELFPPRYNKNSELVVTIAAGKNTFDFNCETKKPSPAKR